MPYRREAEDGLVLHTGQWQTNITLFLSYPLNVKLDDLRLAAHFDDEKVLFVMGISLIALLAEIYINSASFECGM
jgi:hypothetical protein